MTRHAVAAHRQRGHVAFCGVRNPQLRTSDMARVECESCKRSARFGYVAALKAAEQPRGNVS